MKKVVFKLEFYDDKIKQKAMQRVSGISGVESVSIDMKEKKLTITGDIDPIKIAGKLRKLCPTDIVSVGPAKEPEKKKDDKKGGDDKKDDKKDDSSKKGDDKKKDTKDDGVHQLIKAFPPAFHNYPPPPPMHYYNNYPPPPPPGPAYFPRGVEEDPNGCVIS